MDVKIKKIIGDLPDAPGVYLFFNIKKELIYIGKASSLKNRVRSYFVGKKSPRPIEEMIHEVMDIKWVETASALEAAILEGNYIKKYRPKYNVLWRDDKSWNYIVITKEKFPKVLALREHELNLLKKDNPKALKEFDRLFGPYPNLNMREAMKILRRLFFISTCEPKQKKPCFYYQLGQCLGVCTGEISSTEYKQKVIHPLKMFLSGNKKKMMRDLEKGMKQSAKDEKFEEAGRLRNQLSALERIQDIALLNKSFVAEKLSTIKKEKIRIEGYDISNLGITDKVGSMVVFDEVGPVKSLYRKFNIKTVVGQSDVDCLAEVLGRRLNHNEWPMPDVFLVDGGLPQVNRARTILKEKNVQIPIVGIAKGPDRKKNEFFLAENSGKILGQEPREWLKFNKIILIRVRDEAHRFAIAFSRSKRNIK